MNADQTHRPIRHPAGMSGFLIVWSGQLVSLVGSAMTFFALSIYVWQITGQATSFSLLAFFFALPLIAFTPFAGALVDRWNRKLTMMISDIAGLAVNLLMLSLLVWGHLEMWHLYALAVFNGLFQAF
jgi:DHA3 family macrolide efflux protein-like MFS transporter